MHEFELELLALAVHHLVLESGVGVTVQASAAVLVAAALTVRPAADDVQYC